MSSSSSLVSVGTRLLFRSPRHLPQIHPHFRCQPRLSPAPLLRRTFAATRSTHYAPNPKPHKDTDVSADPRERPTLRENIYTIPNLLTASRILACPLLGWSILHDDFYLATGLLVYAGLSDLVSDRVRDGGAYGAECGTTKGRWVLGEAVQHALGARYHSRPRC